jgi:hypothetical protein
MLRLIAIALGTFLPFSASAIKILPDCAETGNCGLSDILATLLNLVEFGLGIAGAVALLYFMYGGFKIILAAGDANKVKDGKTVITHAVIGIIIIFTSGVIVRFATSALTGQQSKVCTEADARSTPPACTPIVGQSCRTARTKEGVEKSSAIWILMPAGGGKPEGPACVKKDDCKDLNEQLKARAVPGVNDKGYDCYATDDPNVQSCVRGLCDSKPGGFACCICPSGKCKK